MAGMSRVICDAPLSKDFVMVSLGKFVLNCLFGVDLVCVFDFRFGMLSR